MMWLMIAGVVVILCFGVYLWRKGPTPGVRLLIAGLTLATCAVFWLMMSASNTPVETQAQSQAETKSQPSSRQAENKNPASATPSAKTPEKSKPKLEEVATQGTPGSGTVGKESAPAGVGKPAGGSIIAKIDKKKLDKLKEDASSFSPHGSTLVNTIVKKGMIQTPDQRSPSEDDYSFPDVFETTDGLAMVIPDEPLPGVSSRRQLTTGEGDVPQTGEVVALSYDMFSWSSGEMVESSKTALNSPLMYRVGGEGNPVGIPKFLNDAIENRPYGSTVQVVFERQMGDLPMYMDKNDGYVLVVRIDKPGMDGDAAIKSMIESLNNPVQTN